MRKKIDISEWSIDEAESAIDAALLHGIPMTLVMPYNMYEGSKTFKQWFEGNRGKWERGMIKVGYFYECFLIIREHEFF